MIVSIRRLALPLALLVFLASATLWLSLWLMRPEAAEALEFDRPIDTESVTLATPHGQDILACETYGRWRLKRRQGADERGYSSQSFLPRPASGVWPACAEEASEGERPFPAEAGVERAWMLGDLLFTRSDHGANGAGSLVVVDLRIGRVVLNEPATGREDALRAFRGKDAGIELVFERSKLLDCAIPSASDCWPAAAADIGRSLEDDPGAACRAQIEALLDAAMPGERDALRQTYEKSPSVITWRMRARQTGGSWPVRQEKGPIGCAVAA